MHPCWPKCRFDHVGQLVPVFALKMLWATVAEHSEENKREKSHLIIIIIIIIMVATYDDDDDDTDDSISSQGVRMCLWYALPVS